jgi:hypothetical protein
MIFLILKKIFLFPTIYVCWFDTILRISDDIFLQYLFRFIFVMKSQCAFCELGTDYLNSMLLIRASCLILSNCMEYSPASEATCRSVSHEIDSLLLNSKFTSRSIRVL